MGPTSTADFFPGKLAHLASLLRGLLAEPTGDTDLPYRPVILKALTGLQAMASASDPGASLPAELARLDRPPLYLDLSVETISSNASVVAWRQWLAGQLAAYVAQHGARPPAICLPELGILLVEKTDIPPSLQPGSLPSGGGQGSGLLLFNKVALVTGAAGAIGHGICRALLDQGCFVAASDLPGERLENLVHEFHETSGGRILGVAMDVTDPDSVAAGFEQVILAWGGVDIVIVNAGIALVSCLTEMSLEAFRNLEKVNVEGSLLTIAAAGRYLTWQGTGGDIVLISTKNVFAPGARFGAYSATKAASHQLARIASLELAEFGIRVNMVAPDAVFSDGGYKSGLWATVGPDRMKARGLDEAGLEEYYRNRNLLKARVTARHVANAVLFFVTHQTPTTGATIPVDGGLPDATPR